MKSSKYTVDGTTVTLAMTDFKKMINRIKQYKKREKQYKKAIKYYEKTR